MVEKGKTEIAQKTLEKYEKQLNRSLEKAVEAVSGEKKEKLEQKTEKIKEGLEGKMKTEPEIPKETKGE